MSVAPVVSNPLGNLNTSLPSTRKMHSFIREKQEIQVKLLTGEVVTGRLLWLDEHCLMIESGEDKMMVWVNAIAYIKF
jgi:host factor-I protein